jgi:hypothetical protein
MGTKAWGDYLQPVQIEIGNLGITAEIYEDQIKPLESWRRRRRAIPLPLRRG